VQKAKDNAAKQEYDYYDLGDEDDDDDEDDGVSKNTSSKELFEFAVKNKNSFNF